MIANCKQVLSFNAGSMPMHHPYPPPTTQRIDNHNFVLIGLAWQWRVGMVMECFCIGHTVQQCNTTIQSLHKTYASSYDCDGSIKAQGGGGKLNLV